MSRLKNLDGDWHEFESKALRRENERREREAARHVPASKDPSARAKEKKRAYEASEQREAKRPHVEKSSQTATGKEKSTAGGGFSKKE